METKPKVPTYRIARHLNIPNYHGRDQFHTLNVVRLLVANVKLGENGLFAFSHFKLTETTTVRCSPCDQESSPLSQHIPPLTLDIEKVEGNQLSNLWTR